MVVLAVLLVLCAICCNSACYATNFNVFGPNATQYAVYGLPGTDYSLPMSWAGQIGVPGTKDDALFFWLFEAEEEAGRQNLIIWLDGGPGCTSLAGLTEENGPLYFYRNATEPAGNPYSWTKLANMLYVDQPVGTGFSSGSSGAFNNTEVTEMFYAWLGAFYTRFPRLRGMNTYLMGESWAGIFIPYFTQAILQDNRNLSISLQGVAMGSPTLGNFITMTDVPISEYLDHYNEILDIPQDVLCTFNQAASICGFDEVLDELVQPPSLHDSMCAQQIATNSSGNLTHTKTKRQTPPDPCISLQGPTTAAQVNESIFSGCFGSCPLWDTASNYLSAVNPCFNYDNIAYTCATAPDPAPPTDYLNLPSVRAAIHAPDKNITACNATIQDVLVTEHVIPPAYSLVPWILEQGITVRIWSGSWDFLLPSLGIELVLQNMTWRGEQGFQWLPNNQYVVDGEIVGRWGSERGLSYHHIYRAGHSVPHDRPAVAFAYVRDFVLGDADSFGF